MVELAHGWHLEVDYSPRWLFFRLHCDDEACEFEPAIADSVWAICDEHHINRIVIELAKSTPLRSHLVGELVLLHKRAHMSSGVCRICGLAPQNYRVLEFMGLTERFPNYPTREDAVMGYRPIKPR
jgi:anti-anti-sigma regulatory factor